MFEVEDIELLEHSPKMFGRFMVKICGINGTIPMRFFSKGARAKIRSWMKMKKSPLYEAVTGEDNEDA
jgi:hypothetical protein